MMVLIVVLIVLGVVVVMNKRNENFTPHINAWSKLRERPTAIENFNVDKISQR